jgi:hypothetical protein
MIGVIELLTAGSTFHLMTTIGLPATRIAVIPPAALVAQSPLGHGSL